MKNPFAVPVVLILAFLSVCTIQAQDRSNPSGTKDYSFTVKAGQVWTDTGLDLDRGDRIHVSGAVMACESSRDEKAHLPLPSAPAGALLLKLHADGDPVNSSTDADMPIVDPSHLYLGVNAWHCGGTIPARVQVERQKAAGGKP